VLVTLLLLALSFVMIIVGAFAFTNSLEWAGLRLGLGHGAVGSVLAAVATALPESTIPVIAILSGEEGGQIAIGAIIGAPLLLATLGMVVVGATALITKRHREHGTRLDVDRPSTVRELAVFLVVLAVALVLGVVGAGTGVRITAAVVFVLGYGAYVWWTIVQNRGASEEDLPRSLFFDPSKHDPPRNVQIVAQVVVSLGLIIGGAQLFVTEIEHIAKSAGIASLVLALAIAPLASELPEKLNSVLWVRQGKDALALGNMTGAMVFQSAVPVAFGLAFTQWQLELPAAVAMVCALVGGALALLNVARTRRFTAPWLTVWLLIYGGVLGYLFLAV
jgi:cation:H+ antiporter